MAVPGLLERANQYGQAHVILQAWAFDGHAARGLRRSFWRLQHCLTRKYGLQFGMPGFVNPLARCEHTSSAHAQLRAGFGRSGAAIGQQTDRGKLTSTTWMRWSSARHMQPWPSEPAIPRTRGRSSLPGPWRVSPSLVIAAQVISWATPRAGNMASGRAPPRTRHGTK